MQRFQGGLAFEAHGLCVSLNSGFQGDEQDKFFPIVQVLSDGFSIEFIFSVNYVSYEYRMKSLKLSGVGFRRAVRRGARGAAGVLFCGNDFPPIFE